MSLYVCTLFIERSNALVRIDLLEPAGLIRQDAALKISTTHPNGAVEVEQLVFQRPTDSIGLGAAALMQTLNDMVYTERGGCLVTCIHYSPDFDPADLDGILSGINLAYQIVGLTTTRTVQ